MKIGIYAYWNVSMRQGSARMLGCHARYLRHFLDFTDGVRLFTPLATSAADSGLEAICDSRLEIVPLGVNSFISAWLSLPSLRRTMQTHLEGLDAMYVRLFDPCPWLWARLCQQRGIGLVYDMVGDPVQGILQRRDWSWAGRWARRGLFLPEEWLTFRAARQHTLLLNGSEVARRYGHRHPLPETIYSSTLEEEDFVCRSDTCGGGPVRVLYVGMLRPAKRLETLIDALARLVAENREVSLRIVGAAEPASYLASLRARVRDRKLEGHVHFAGYVPLGAPLSQEYRNADIYAFPSLTEGAARTLLEAAAASVPCVLTDVGGARDLFQNEHSALIIPPDDAPAMANAIGRMIDDGPLRRACLTNAYEMARRHTCREFVRGMVGRLEAASDKALDRRIPATSPAEPQQLVSSRACA